MSSVVAEPFLKVLKERRFFCAGSKEVTAEPTQVPCPCPSRALRT